MLNGGGSARTRVVFTATSEFGRRPISASREPDFGKIDESFAQEETGGQCLPRVFPDGQGGNCSREVQGEI